MNNGKLGIIILVVAAVIVIVAVRALPSQSVSATAVREAQTSQETDTSVQVTFPKAYFTDAKTSDDAQSMLETLGCTAIAAQDNGSYTASLSQDKYETLVKNEYDKAKETVDGMAGSSRFPNIASATYDDNLTSITITLASDQAGLADTYAPDEAGTAAIIYQTIAGLPVGCTVTESGASGGVLAQTTYPQ